MQIFVKTLTKRQLHLILNLQTLLTISRLKSRTKKEFLQISKDSFSLGNNCKMEELLLTILDILHCKGNDSI
ncbi:unnamed protein product [Blepharisma stoltei]|uniref:Uncharacterized protein n=1 Tax=Blepharisma stoltei TaxID=1481888 RepID=A0AAU9IWH9_9CILI|nr:unnamed protein product [Blepharisma stoltei]